MERYAIYIPYAGDARLQPCNDDGNLELAELQSLVGGYIEITDSVLSKKWAKEPCDRIVIVCNEEGKLYDLPVNENATALLPGGFGLDHIVGNAVLMMARDEELFGFNLAVAEHIIEKWELSEEADYGSQAI